MTLGAPRNYVVPMVTITGGDTPARTSTPATRTPSATRTPNVGRTSTPSTPVRTRTGNTPTWPKNQTSITPTAGGVSVGGAQSLDAYAEHVDEIRRLYAAGEADAALKVAEAVRAPVPSVSLDAIPVVAMRPEHIMILPLDPREGFFLARIDGTSELRVILEIVAMPRPEALAILDKLLGLGAVRLLPPGGAPSVPPRGRA